MIKEMELNTGLVNTVIIETLDITGLSVASNDILVYRTNNGRVWLYDLKYQIKQELRYQNIDFPCLSDDGEKMLCCFKNTKERDDWDIEVCNLVTGGVDTLVDTEGYCSSPSYISNSDQIVYSLSKPPYAIISVYDSSTAVSYRFVPNSGSCDFEPMVSQGGKIVAFSSNRARDFDLWLYYLESQKFDQLTTEKGFEGRPIWLSDSEIIFECNHPDHWGIWKINIHTRKKELMTPKGEKCRYPALGF